MSETREFNVIEEPQDRRLYPYCAAPLTDPSAAFPSRGGTRWCAECDGYWQVDEQGAVREETP